MPLVLQNVRKVIKPNGFVLFRDYATGDLAQERLTCKDQKISENFYVRGDGTRAFYFCEEFLKQLFEDNGFSTKECGLCCKKVENRSREIVMNRRWIQAAFRLDGANAEINGIAKEPKDGVDVDISEGFAFDMFGISSSNDEIMEFKLRDWSFKIKLLSKEFQHTCKSTGLMLWESAQLMSSILTSNQAIVSGKSVLELGCGCAGICSMVATKTARLVVPTDGDDKALDLLSHNITSNLDSPALAKLSMQKLQWGNRDHIEAVKKLNGDKGFDVILGTDVTYVPEATMPLFQTAKELISSDGVLILCHVFRRVDEASILSAASCFGLKLVDRWPNNVIPGSRSQSIIDSWFEGGIQEDVPSKALNIMYFLAE